MALYLVTIQRV